MGELAEYLQQHSPDFRKARIAALYSDFRAQRTVNPDGYQANISAWRVALSLLASGGLFARLNSSSTNFTVELDDSLLRSLEDKRFGQPLALGTVVRDALSTRTLVPIQEFKNAKGNISQKGWAEIPWNVASWTLKSLGVIDPARGDDKLPKGRFVLIDPLNAACARFKEETADLVTIFDQVFTKSQFCQKFSTQLLDGQRLSNTDMEILLQFLSRDRGLISYDGQHIRISGTGEKDAPEITEEDKSIASMKELTASLEHQTSLLGNRIDELTQSAKAAIAKGNRTGAMGALKSKKIAEKSLAERYATLNQLEEISARIEQATDNVQLVKVMESSTGVLTSLNKQVGGTEKIDSVMDALREEMASTDEVAAILAEGSGTVVDEAELDDELEMMEKEERQKIEEQKASVKQAKEERDAELAKQKLEALPDIHALEGEEQERRAKASTPTSETGIAQLSLG